MYFSYCASRQVFRVITLSPKNIIRIVQRVAWIVIVVWCDLAGQILCHNIICLHWRRIAHFLYRIMCAMIYILYYRWPRKTCLSINVSLVLFGVYAIQIAALHHMYYVHIMSYMSYSIVPYDQRTQHLHVAVVFLEARANTYTHLPRIAHIIYRMMCVINII